MTTELSNHSLDRYVLPVHAPIPLDANGFLKLRSADAWWEGTEARPQSVVDLAGSASSFVLLAAGGVGKTTVLRELQAREPGATEIDLRTLDKGGMRDELLAAIAADAPVYLDALDEAIASETAVFRILQRHMTQQAARQVPWRLACRPAAWNSALAEALRDSLPGFEELRLLPLSHAAASEVAASTGADPERFLDVLIRANLGRLAAAPMQLRAAARQWSTTGDLPDSHVDAIRFEIRELLAETDRGRPQPSFPTDRQHRLAKRLGAIAVFGRVTRFGTAAESAPGIHRVADLPSTPEPDEPGIPITLAQYQEVLGTALFDAAPDATVAFRHQQYAEYLAAAYLVQRGITPPQLPALLGVHANGLLPGPLVGVAAWLAALNPGLTDDLIPANALGFAQAGVELPSHHLRAAVVDGLLSKAAKGDIDPAWGLDLSGLAHQELEEQLDRHLDGGLARPEQLWWISQLATAGNCKGLVSTLLRETLIPSWPDWARRAGIAVVAALGDDAELVQLRPLLHLDQTDDPDDALLAAVVEALYPRLLSTTDLLDVLRPRRNTSLVGGYLVQLGKLSGKFPPEDLPAVLDWAAARVQDGENAYGRLFPELAARGWAHADSTAVRKSLARLVAALARDQSWYCWRQREGLPWSDGEIGQRRLLAVAVAEHVGDQAWYRLLDLRLVIPDDVPWHLDNLPSFPAPAQTAVADCIPHLVSHPTTEVADLILGLPEGHPAYGPTQRLRQPVSIDSDIAKRLRELHSPDPDDRDLRTTNREERQTQLAAELSEAEGDISVWWRFVFWLSVDDDNHAGDALFAHDLAIRPGWSLLDDRQRQRALELGLQYLRVHELEPSTWIGQQKIFTSHALPDWSGVYLLTTLTRHDPDRLQDLEPAIWQRWAKAIVGAWNFDRDDDARLRCDLVDLAPPDGRPSILDAALDQLDALHTHDKHLSPYNLYEHLCPDLAPTLAKRLIAERYSGELACAVLHLLVKRAPQVALVTCRQLRANPASGLAPLARSSLAELDPSDTVDNLDASEATADDLAEVVPHLNLSPLDEAHLATLGRLLLDRFPFAEDPPAPSGVFSLGPHFNARRSRSSVLERLAELGQTRQLEKLARQHPEPDRTAIAWHLRNARTRAADLGFTPPGPGELLQLLGRADARLVRHSGHLLDVVLEQLRQLQHEITHNGASRDLWNFGPAGTSRPKSEDDISDWVSRYLEPRLAQGGIVDREIQVERRKPQGIGTRVDLTATAPTATQPVNAARVIIEAKLIHNPTLMTAMQEQLMQQYLVPAGLQHGVYLVYWVHPDQRPDDWSTSWLTDMAVLMKQLNRQAEASENYLYVRPFLLDISQSAP